jgi:ABC-type transport system substrate-binding protein
VKWSNGDAFDARDVVFNLNRWCEKDVPGNSMAGRMGSLIDAATHGLRPEKWSSLMYGFEPMEDLGNGQKET